MKHLIKVPFDYLTNKFFNWVSGIELHHCYECKLYRFGNWVQAAFADMDECGCYRHRKKPRIKYIWVCLKCQEYLGSVGGNSGRRG